MRHLGVVLGGLALAGVGILYARVDELADLVRNPRTTERPPASSLPELREEAEDVPSLQPAATKELRARIEKLEAQLEDSRGDRFELTATEWPSDASGLARALSLDDARAKRLGEIIERGLQRVDDTYAIPGPDGTSPKGVRDTLQRLLDAAAPNRGGTGEISTRIQDLSARLVSLLGTTIPGRDETYGDAFTRIDRETRAEIEALLEPDELEKFEDLSTELILDGWSYVAQTLDGFDALERLDGDR